MKNDVITLDNIFDNIDFTGVFDTLIDFFEKTRPKIIKRKYRRFGKIKYQYVVIRYPLADYLLDSTYFGIRIVRKLIGSNARI